MNAFSKMKALDLWYFAFDSETLISGIKDAGIRRGAIKKTRKRVRAAPLKASFRSSRSRPPGSR